NTFHTVHYVGDRRDGGHARHPMVDAESHARISSFKYVVVAGGHHLVGHDLSFNHQSRRRKCIHLLSILIPGSTSAPCPSNPGKKWPSYWPYSSYPQLFVGKCTGAAKVTNPTTTALTAY